jgi:hypothetical protein
MITPAEDRAGQGSREATATTKHILAAGQRWQTSRRACTPQGTAHAEFKAHVLPSGTLCLHQMVGHVNGKVWQRISQVHIAVQTTS